MGQQEIMQALKASMRYMTATELIEITGSNRGNLEHALRSLVKQGCVVRRKVTNKLHTLEWLYIND